MMQALTAGSFRQHAGDPRSANDEGNGDTPDLVPQMIAAA